MKKRTSFQKINWNEQFKIKPRRNASRLHELIKLNIVIGLIEKYKKNLRWIRIYTEFPVGEGKICDVYFENIKTNEIYCYEIQKNISKKWLEETKKFYSEYKKIFFNTNWILVEENKFKKIEKQLEKIKKDLEKYII